MATVPTQVRIDENLKKQACELFSQLGMDMSGAMNIFLKQCVLRGGLPFSVELPQYKPEVLEAMEEANRCLGCKKAKCMEGCPVSINIPGFVHEVKEGNFEKAYQIIGESSALPAVCGRVCPQETQCEGKCIRGLKGEAVSIGKLERFVADWAKENGIKPVPAAQ